MLLATFLCNAQKYKDRLLAGAGYTYFNRSFANVGAKYLIKDDEKSLFGQSIVGVNLLVGYANHKILLIPEAEYSLYFAKDNKSLPKIFKLSVSPNTITPQIGISMIFVEISAGYGFSIKDSPNYKTNGFRANLNINIPLLLK